jgi:hypothetical protein
VAAKATLVEHDHMIEAFAANGTDQAFYVGTLPGCTRCGQYLLDAHGLQLVHKLISKNAIAIAQQKARRRVSRKGFA